LVRVQSGGLAEGPAHRPLQRCARHLEHGGMVRLIAIACHVAGVDQHAPAVDDEGCPPRQAKLLHERAAGRAELAQDVVGEGDNPLHIRGGAPALLGQWQIVADGEDAHLLAQHGRLLIEAPRLAVAHRSLERGQREQHPHHPGESNQACAFERYAVLL